MKVLAELGPPGHPFGILKIQFHHLTGGESHGQRTQRTVDARIEHGIEPELQSQLLLHKPFHIPDFMFVERQDHGLENEGKVPFHDQPDASHTALKRAWDTRDAVMNLRGSAINGNFDREGPPFCKIVSCGSVDKGPVGKESEEQPFLFGISVDVEEIRPGKDFTSRVKEPETTGVRYFVQDTAVFLVSELAPLRLSMACREVVIAMSTLHIAAPGEFYRATDGRSMSYDLLVKF